MKTTNNNVNTPIGLHIATLILQGDVHRARIESAGQRLTHVDRKGIVHALKKWNVSPITFFT